MLDVDHIAVEDLELIHLIPRDAGDNVKIWRCAKCYGQFRNKTPIYELGYASVKHEVVAQTIGRQEFTADFKKFLPAPAQSDFDGALDAAQQWESSRRLFKMKKGTADDVDKRASTAIHKLLSCVKQVAQHNLFVSTALVRLLSEQGLERDEAEQLVARAGNALEVQLEALRASLRQNSLENKLFDTASSNLLENPRSKEARRIFARLHEERQRRLRLHNLASHLVDGSELEKKASLAEFMALFHTIEDQRQIFKLFIAHWYERDELMAMLGKFRMASCQSNTQYHAVHVLLKECFQMPVPGERAVTEDVRRQKIELFKQLGGNQPEPCAVEFEPRKLIEFAIQLLNDEQKTELKRMKTIRTKLAIDGAVYDSFSHVVLSFTLVDFFSSTSPLSNMVLAGFSGKKSFNWEDFHCQKYFFREIGQVGQWLAELVRDGLSIVVDGTRVDFQIDNYWSSDMKGFYQMYNIEKPSLMCDDCYRVAQADPDAALPRNCVSCRTRRSNSMKTCVVPGCEHCCFKEAANHEWINALTGDPLDSCLPLSVVPPNKFVLCLLHALLRTSEGLMQILTATVQSCRDQATRRQQLREDLATIGVSLPAVAIEDRFLKQYKANGEDAVRLMRNARGLGSIVRLGSNHPVAGEFHGRLYELIADLDLGERPERLVEHATVLRNELLQNYETFANSHPGHRGVSGRRYIHALLGDGHIQYWSKFTPLRDFSNEGLEALHKVIYSVVTPGQYLSC